MENLFETNKEEIAAIILEPVVGNSCQLVHMEGDYGNGGTNRTNMPGWVLEWKPIGNEMTIANGPISDCRS